MARKLQKTISKMVPNVLYLIVKLNIIQFILINSIDTSYILFRLERPVGYSQGPESGR